MINRLIAIAVVGLACSPIGAQDTATTATAAETTAPQALNPCADLPTGNLSDEELERLVPEMSPGKVRIGWKTESQEETYGFNILRADQRDGPYQAINPAIIPGEGTTNIPTAYCFEDVGVKRGETYYYQIQEVTNAGARTIVEGTEGTQVKVKTVPEEREWLRTRAAQAATASQ